MQEEGGGGRGRKEEEARMLLKIIEIKCKIVIKYNDPGQSTTRETRYRNPPKESIWGQD